MSEKEKMESHDKAWDLLEEKGLSQREKMMVRHAFVDWSGYKEEHPFISRTYKKGQPEYFYSTDERIKSYRFETESEVVLANAILLNMEDKVNANDFIQLFKYTCRLIGMHSKWV